IFSVDEWLGEHLNPIPLLLAFPAVYLGAISLSVLAVIALKWILVGRFKTGVHPLWSPWIWINELVTGLHDGYTAQFLVHFLAGTPFMAHYLRALGAKVGRGTYIDTCNMTEFDLIDIGDGAEINIEATIQPHLFEDRIFKLSEVHIGKDVS